MDGELRLQRGFSQDVEADCKQGHEVVHNEGVIWWDLEPDVIEFFLSQKHIEWQECPRAQEDEDEKDDPKSEKGTYTWRL